MSAHRILVFADETALARAAAEYLALLAQAAVAARGRFLAALSGGGTPAPLYRNLTTAPFRAALPWSALHFFWGDERCVPPADPGSNFGSFAAILGDLAGQTHLQRVRGELAPGAAADDYAARLAAAADGARAWPRFDLVLLGLGRDGHTASLFPGRFDPVEDSVPVLAVQGNYDGRPAERVTMTPAVFNEAAHLAFLVTGADKADAVAATLHGPREPDRYPAQRIQPRAGLVTWFLDRQAAAALSPGV